MDLTAKLLALSHHQGPFLVEICPLVDEDPSAWSNLVVLRAVLVLYFIVAARQVLEGLLSLVRRLLNGRCLYIVRDVASLPDKGSNSPPHRHLASPLALSGRNCGGALGPICIS